MELFYDILKQLIRIPSVTGEEHPFFMYIKRELEEIGVKVSHYDGLLVASGDDPKSGYISAHVDRHGLICTGPNEFQYAAFIAKNQADLKGNSHSKQLLMNFTNRFVDEKVQAYEPWSGNYLGVGEIKNAYLCPRRHNVIFEIGGLDFVFPGTPIAFMDKLKVKKDYISAQLDNVLSVAIIIYMYHLGYKGTSFFSASEEAGKSWRFILEWFKSYDLAINELLVLDTSPYQSLEDIKKIDIVLRNRDANAQFKSPLKKKIKTIATKMKIRYHFKDTYLREKAALSNTPVTFGTTELGRIIHASKGEIQGATLQIPTIGYHTVDETATKKSIQSVIDILTQLYNSKNEG